jgi:hypothetical protein
MPHTTSLRPVPPTRSSLSPERPSCPSSPPPRRRCCISRVRGLCRPSAARFRQRAPPAPFLPSAAQAMLHTTTHATHP